MSSRGSVRAVRLLQIARERPASRLPPMPKLHITLVGRGRVGGALARALRRRHHVRLVAGQSHPHQPADLVLLCVPDGAVAETALRVSASLTGRPVIAHCAGALGLEVFAALPRRFATGSLHPLQAVPSSRTPLQAYAAVESASPKARKLLLAVARDAGLEPFLLHHADRAAYHAAAVLASNGLLALASRASALLSAAGVPPHVALRALLPLMRSALDGLELGLPKGLTGPIARGDVAVVQSHLGALRASQDRALYLALSTVLVAESRRLGAAPAKSLAAIERLLAGQARKSRATP